MNPCSDAAPQHDNEGDGRWNSIHNRFLSDAKGKEADVVFIGDSILQALEHTEVWNQWFAPLHCLNFSIHRDQTQNVLWRIKNGELDHVDPKVVVLHVGTNNVDHSAEQICEGILEIVRIIREKHPNSYIVLPSLLPRGQHPNCLREKNSKINQLLREKVVNMNKVEMVFIDKGFIQSDGTISHHDMHDYLIPTNTACRKAFEPIYDLLQQILSESETEKDLTPSE
ncbi:PREDICTED: platelet-activating factor acetylhydrolase IB subunit beta homolog [Papilio polytes]|uniref:platelet-activating factor acetylhydrolase IB subunit beta homolog n=1 Tax=Papilio polytes TaxID=76194 RepID=UPI000675EC24|nr:PREDICTED: platelet-activating factor acetylhydrolase IB subunit beta homolog [Papilio polytes]